MGRVLPPPPCGIWAEVLLRDPEAGQFISDAAWRWGLGAARPGLGRQGGVLIQSWRLHKRPQIRTLPVAHQGGPVPLGTGQQEHHWAAQPWTLGLQTLGSLRSFTKLSDRATPHDSDQWVATLSGRRAHARDPCPTRILARERKVGEK